VLIDPSLQAQRAQIDFTATEALAMLEAASTPAPSTVQARLRSVRDRARLPAVAATLASSAEPTPVLRTGLETGRSIPLILLGTEGAIVGFEILPSILLSHLLEGWRTELEAPPPALEARLLPPEQPYASDHGTTMIFSTAVRGLPGWQLALSLPEEQDQARLAESRTHLYLGVLLLLVGVLLGGILRTAQVMRREAQLARLKTDFVSRVSHELRTPLTSIRMFTETLLLGRAPEEAAQRECLETIGRESERLSRMVERILDFARMEAGRKAYRITPTPVRETLEVALAACRPLLEERGMQLSTTIPAALPPVAADPDALVEVVINLVSNAVKFSTPGGEVSLHVEAAAGMLALGVRDHGVGIPRAEQARIFERFYRAEQASTEKTSGSGLGLSLVRHIVEAHGGTVTVDSAPGRGSVFTVRWPLAAEGRDG